MLLVRKNTENCHSYYTVEGYYLSERYIIIDDCIATGKTILNMVEKLEEMCNTFNIGKKIMCYGVCLYINNMCIEDVLRKIPYEVKIL